MGAGIDVHEEVENQDGKQRVGQNVNRKDLVINNTGLKGALFKHIHVTERVPTGQC